MKVPGIEKLVDNVKKIVPLSEQDIDLLQNHIKHRRYLKGQFILQQGDICRYQNFITSGCLKVFYTDNEGQEHIVMFGIEEWWAADLGSFINNTDADYNIQCLEQSEVLQFSKEDLEALYIKIPQLERFFRIIIQRAYIASQKRIINNFSMTAKERYLQFRSQYPHIEQRVPQYMIASFLGITKEFLSKIRSQLILEQ